MFTQSNSNKSNSINTAQQVVAETKQTEQKSTYLSATYDALSLQLSKTINNINIKDDYLQPNSNNSFITKKRNEEDQAIELSIHDDLAETVRYTFKEANNFKNGFLDFIAPHWLVGNFTYEIEETDEQFLAEYPDGECIRMLNKFKIINLETGICLHESDDDFYSQYKVLANQRLVYENKAHEIIILNLNTQQQEFCFAKFKLKSLYFMGETPEGIIVHERNGVALIGFDKEIYKLNLTNIADLPILLPNAELIITQEQAEEKNSDLNENLNQSITLVHTYKFNSEQKEFIKTKTQELKLNSGEINCLPLDNDSLLISDYMKTYLYRLSKNSLTEIPLNRSSMFNVINQNTLRAVNEAHNCIDYYEIKRLVQTPKPKFWQSKSEINSASKPNDALATTLKRSYSI